MPKIIPTIFILCHEKPAIITVIKTIVQPFPGRDDNIA